jgi:putative YhdH/YhfP family quinone oxidoreductase
MEPISFRALVVEQTAANDYVLGIVPKTVADLPEGPVLIKVHYSSLNYKDALSARGNKGVTRRYPHTPGIDAAGEVVESDCAEFRTGQKVIVTSYDLGMNTPGGFGQFIRVPAEWVVPLPHGLTLKESMAFGTAGFTAALALYKLEQAGLRPQAGEVLVTGASGGVGSLAVAILSRRGYRVAAASGKENAVDWLRALGAQRIVARETVAAAPDKALLPKQWAAVIDTVGGRMLSGAIRALAPHGLAASCGNAGSPDLVLTVYPFIIRGVSLLGVDSATCPMPIRRSVWQRLATDWKPDHLSTIFSEISLEQLEENVALMLKGGMTGRRVVRLW